MPRPLGRGTSCTSCLSRKGRDRCGRLLRRRGRASEPRRACCRSETAFAFPGGAACVRFLQAKIARDRAARAASGAEGAAGCADAAAGCSAGRTRKRNRTASVSMRFISSSNRMNASFLNSTSGSFWPYPRKPMPSFKWSSVRRWSFHWPSTTSSRMCRSSQRSVCAPKSASFSS